MLLVLLIPLATALIPCFVANMALPTADDMIDANCTSVVLLNVVAEGNMIINLSISGIVLANPNAPSITVTISNLTLMAGAALVIDSRRAHYSFFPPMLSIKIQLLSGRNAALVFAGAFPRGSSILVSDMQMTIDNIAIAPKLPLFDIVNPGHAKGGIFGGAGGVLAIGGAGPESLVDCERVDGWLRGRLRHVKQQLDHSYRWRKRRSDPGCDDGGHARTSSDARWRSGSE